MQAPEDGGTPGTRVRRFSNRSMGYGILDLGSVFLFPRATKEIGDVCQQVQGYHDTLGSRSADLRRN